MGIFGMQFVFTTIVMIFTFLCYFVTLEFTNGTTECIKNKITDDHTTF